MNKYLLIKERETNYALAINESDNLGFNKIRELSSVFYRMLPKGIQERLYNDILHGACELDSEPKLNAYMFALGKMHNAKLQRAYENLSTDFLSESQIDIIDYACGQGLGTICYADFLKRTFSEQKVRRIILIEPSKIALARAALHVAVLFPDAELITINKGFDDLTSDDLFADRETPTLHILSNVLDLGTTDRSDGFFDLKNFAELVSQTVDGKNEIICIDPLFGFEPKDEKVELFINDANIDTYYQLDKGRGEFVSGEVWTCVIRIGRIYKNTTNTLDTSINQYMGDAERGDAKAQYELGRCYCEGKGVDKDFTQAVYWFSKSAEQGYDEAQCCLGCRYKKGEGIKKDLDKAIYWFFKSIEQRNRRGQLALGVCYEYGEGVGKDLQKAVFWYTKSAEQGNATAQKNLGWCYEYGEGVGKDLQKAVFWYTKSAEQGNAYAQYNLGWCYKNGEGVDKDHNKVVFWWTKSAEQGNATAQSNLGVCYKNGYGVDKDHKKAFFWWTKSAEQGNATAQKKLGVCYKNGEGVGTDLQKAFFWYTKSAEQGNATAQFNLGVCYEYGEGVGKDLQKAFFWYTKSAEQGNAEAQNNLGWCYKNGYGVGKDHKKAVFWWTRSAEQGNAEAQNNLGWCYKNGYGVDKDHNKAVFWYTKSAEQGNARAQKKLTELSIVKGRQSKISSSPKSYDWSNDYSDRDTFYALTDGMYGDYEDWGGDISSLKEFLGLD